MWLRILSLFLIFLLTSEASQANNVQRFLLSNAEESFPEELKEKLLEEEVEFTSIQNTIDENRKASGNASGNAIPISNTSYTIQYVWSHLVEVKKTTRWIVLFKNPRYIHFCVLKLHLL